MPANYQAIDGSTRTVFSLGKPSAPARKCGYFGYAQSTATLNTALTAFQTYITLTTPSIPAGIYELNFSALATNTTNSRDAEIRVTVGGVEVWRAMVRSVGGGERHAFGGNYIHTVAADGAQTALIQYRSVTSGSVFVYQGTISMRRVA